MKLPGKALLYRDFKYSKWFMLLLFLELFVLFLLPDFVFFEKSYYPRLNLFYGIGRYIISFLLIVITMVLMSTSLFYYDRKLTNYTLAASMPFKRSDIITSKWCVGLYIIFVPFLSIYMLMNTLLITKFCWQMFFFEITKWFILGLLLTLCIFGFVMTLQSLNGSAIIGSILTLLFAALPFSILYPLLGIFHSHYQMIHIPHFIPKPPLIRVVESFYLGNFHINIGFGKTVALSIFFLVLIPVFYFFSLQIFNRICLEKTGCITALSAFEKLYKAVLSYYAGFFVHVISSMITPKYAFRPDIVILCCVILPIPVYFAAGKAIKIYNKRFA